MASSSLHDRLAPLVRGLYPERSEAMLAALEDLADRWRPRLAGRAGSRPTERTVYLITYGGSVRRAGEKPLRTLGEVLRRHVGDAVSDLHLLPIYPWTSDDGFGVTDHRAVDPELGTWGDIADLREDYALALDFVANHVSSSSAWFEGWLRDDPRFAGFFLQPGPDFDVSQVVRPRVTPLVHDYPRPDGSMARAWTTFGADQVDVDPSTPGVLLELTDILLSYLDHGATTVRLDAIGFLWKQSGTTCIHLPQTHAVIRIWRVLVEELAPGTVLLTETNVPHADNITYFGDGENEAHMVYQFALPPLVLHAFVTGRVTALARWASDVGPVSESATWFNFLASHDGIGLRPTEGLLDDEDRVLLVERTLACGGRTSMARRPDGSEGVYELNTNFLEALADPRQDVGEEGVVARGLAAHAILLSLVGVPAVYIHSLFGSTQDIAGVESSGIARRINREVLDADRLVAELGTSVRRHGMLEGLRAMLAARRTLPGLSPFASQRIEQLDDRVLVIRRAEGTDDELVAAINVSADTVALPGLAGLDAITGRQHDGVTLEPFGRLWLIQTR